MRGESEEKVKEVDMYETVCRERFDELAAGQKELIALLRGHNGDAGLLDDMRAIKKAYRLVIGAVVFILGALTIQGVDHVWHWFSPPAAVSSMGTAAADTPPPPDAPAK